MALLERVIGRAVLVTMLCLVCVASASPRELARLEEAFDRSARAEYIAEVPVAFPESPDIRKAIYYR